MNKKIIDPILNLQENSHCVDYFLSEYLLLTKRLDNKYFQNKEKKIDKNDIENELKKLSYYKLNLIKNLFEFLKLVEQLDIELSQNKGDEL